MFELYQSVGKEERRAVDRVMKSGLLSGFISGPPDYRSREINGGPEVQKVEEEWADRYGVKYAISFNSATSALLAACKAVGVKASDHVICPPWTMSATAAAPIFCGATIDFVDIEEDYYCLDPVKVEWTCRWKRPRAIMAVNLFGQPAALSDLKRLCDEWGSYLIEDCAQAPYAVYEIEGQKIAGTIGDIGVYSLNRHKHIQCGEGGIAVTDNDSLAEAMRAVRNHGIKPIGLNLRMTELQAAVARVQLRDIDRHIAARVELAEALSDGLRDEMDVPKVRPGCTHNYYLWTAKMSPGQIAKLKIPHIRGYIQPLHKAFKADHADCPVVERLRNETVCFEICRYDIPDPAVVVEAFRKVLK